MFSFQPRAAVSGHFPLTGSHWGLGGQLLSASWGRGVRAEEIAGPSPCPATLDKGRDAGIHSSCGHRKLGPLRDSSSATESLESQQWSASSPNEQLWMAPGQNPFGRLGPGHPEGGEGRGCRPNIWRNETQQLRPGSTTGASITG